MTTGRKEGQPPRRKPKVADYELLRCIGDGSYGDVWLARSVTGHLRALKVIYAGDRESVALEREFKGILRVDGVSHRCSGLVRVLHVARDESGGFFYYVMDLADDLQDGQNINPETYSPKTLARVLEETHRLAFTGVVELGMALAKTLSSIHENGLVHRDIKPSNIIFIHSSPQLADLGLMAALKDPRSFVGGTDGFSPPEGPGSAQSDIYSLGKVLYEAATGRDRTEFPTLPPDIDRWNDATGLRELNEVLIRACDNDPLRRYRTASELYADLGCLLNGKSIRKIRILERRLRDFKRYAAAVGVAVSLLGAVGFELFRESQRSRQHEARVVGAALADAYQAWDRGDYLQALPFFVKALEADKAENQELHRVRIQSTLDQCPKLLHLLAGPSEATDARFASDGQRFLVCSRHHGVRVFDSTSGEPQTRFFGPKQQLEMASFDPEGGLILAASQTGTASIWDWRTETEIRRFTHSNRVFMARYNRSGTKIVTACGDGRGRIWDAKSGKMDLELPRRKGGVRCAAFSLDEQLVGVGGEDALVTVYRTDGSVVLENLQHRSWVSDIAFSPEGNLLASCCVRGQAYLWDLRTGRLRLPPLRHSDGVASIDFSPDGRSVLTACWDGTAQLWDVTTGQHVAINPIFPHSGRVLRAAFAPDGRRLSTACYDGTVKVWDLGGTIGDVSSFRGKMSDSYQHTLVSTDHGLFMFDGRQETAGTLTKAPQIDSVKLSGEGRFVISQVVCTNSEKSEKDLVIRDTATFREHHRIHGVSNDISRIQVSANGEHIATWSRRIVTVWDKSTALPPRSLTNRSTLIDVNFGSVSGHMAVVAGKDVTIYELKGKSAPLILKHDQPVNHATFNFGETLIATACGDDLFTPAAAHIWNIKMGKQIRDPVSHRDGVRHTSFSPDSRYLVTGGEDFKASVASIRDSGNLMTLIHKDQVVQVRFTACGGKILTLSKDRSLRLWEARSGEPLTPPLPHAFDIPNAAILNRNRLLAADNQGGLWLWRIGPVEGSAKDVNQLVRLLNGMSISRDSGDDEGLEHVWRRLKSKFGAVTQLSAAERVNWHSNQFRIGAAESNLAEAIHRRELRE